MVRREREIVERDVHAVSEQAAAASAIVDEGLDAGLDGSHPITVHAKMLRLELLNVQADLERELGRLPRTLVCPDPSASYTSARTLASRGRNALEKLRRMSY